MKRIDLYKKLIEIHAFLSENKKDLNVMNHPAAALAEQKICSLPNAGFYLKRMEGLRMVKRNAFMPLRVLPVTFFHPAIKQVAKSIGYPQISHKPVDKSVKTVDNLLINGTNPVDKPVDNFPINVDNLIARVLFGKSYPHPVDKVPSYPQSYPQARI